jgi:hypothetical protein
MIPFLYRTAFLWIIFSIILGGKNWVFPYGVKGAILSVREHREATARFRSKGAPDGKVIDQTRMDAP